MNCDGDGFEPRVGWKRPFVVGFGANEAGCGGSEFLNPSNAEEVEVGAIPGVKVPFVGDGDDGSTVGFGGAKKVFGGALEVASVEKREGLLIVSFCCGDSSMFFVVEIRSTVKGWNRGDVPNENAGGVDVVGGSSNKPLAGPEALNAERVDG